MSSLITIFCSIIFYLLPNNVPVSNNSVFSTLNSEKSNQHSLTIEVTNVRNSKGLILVAVYNTEKGFPRKQENIFKKLAIEAKEEKISVTVEQMPKGKYAVAILHDENKNYKMDWSIFGMPKEGFGFSNDARGFMAPPSFKAASFDLTGNTAISFKTSYFL